MNYNDLAIGFSANRNIEIACNHVPSNLCGVFWVLGPSQTALNDSARKRGKIIDGSLQRAIRTGPVNLFGDIGQEDLDRNPLPAARKGTINGSFGDSDKLTATPKKRAVGLVRFTAGSATDRSGPPPHSARFRASRPDPQPWAACGFHAYEQRRRGTGRANTECRHRYGRRRPSEDSV